MNLKRTGRVVWSVVAALAVGAVSGCALAPVAALGVAGNVADVGNAAFTAGTEVFAAGQLESVEFATIDTAQTAVRWTFNDLRLRVKESSFTKLTAHYDFVDDAGSEVWVDLKQRSPAICQVRVDVGMFGSEAYARLLLKSIRARLPAAQRMPATQPYEPTDLNASREYKGFSQDNLDR